MKIANGLFKGVEVPVSELTLIINEEGECHWWPVSSRTPYFLSVFSPLDGWAIEIQSEPGQFDLPDYRNRSGSDVVVQPTRQFSASLKKNGVIVNQASSLEVIDGPKAWERGETNARGRLYEALGLSGSVSRKGSLIPSLGLTGTLEAAPEAIAPDKKAGKPADPSDALETVEIAGQEVPANESVAACGKVKEPQRSLKKVDTPNIDRNLWQQIVTITAAKGMEIPNLQNNEEAKAFLIKALTDKKP